MNGILVVDKPTGPTSHDVVAKVRRALKEKKIGHTGTLDPLATGVLPLVVGGATKVARYLSGGDKTYRATIKLGVNTTTLDAEGEAVSTRDVTASEADVRRVANSFVGEIMQVPPMYSAKKIDGQRLYELARKGVEIEREAKKIVIHELAIVSIDLPVVVLDVRCSAGTYVRVLAQDMGDQLGCGGHLQALRRLAAGPFVLADAVALEEIIENPQAAIARILPADRALAMLPRIEVSSAIGRMVKDGYQLSVADLRTLDTPRFELDQALALSTDTGDLIAVVRSLISSTELPTLRRETRALKTERVFARGR